MPSLSHTHTKIHSFKDNWNVQTPHFPVHPEKILFWLCSACSLLTNMQTRFILTKLYIWDLIISRSTQFSLGLTLTFITSRIWESSLFSLSSHWYVLLHSCQSLFWVLTSLQLILPTTIDWVWAFMLVLYVQPVSFFRQDLALSKLCRGGYL